MDEGQQQVLDDYDVVVVGGGAAGLNGALMLARSRRSVLVVDAGTPRNAPAHAVHGLLGREGTPPGELLAAGRAEVRSYGGHVVDGEVVTVGRTGSNDLDHGFELTLADGRSVRSRRLLVTTGLVDELPDVPGLRERWGRDVLHCPYCHGWEVRDQAIAVLATSPMAVHQSLLFSQLSPDVVLITHGVAFEPDQRALLAAAGVRVVDARVESLVVRDDALAAVRLDDGTELPRQALVVAPRMVARAGLLAALGLDPVDHPSGAGVHVPSELAGVTAVPGVWVAGNVTDLTAQVGASAAAGALAGAHINADLVMADARRALAGEA